jgi:hypothetical protein
LCNNKSRKGINNWSWITNIRYKNLCKRIMFGLCEIHIFVFNGLKGMVMRCENWHHQSLELFHKYHQRTNGRNTSSDVTCNGSRITSTTMAFMSIACCFFLRKSIANWNIGKDRRVCTYPSQLVMNYLYFHK